MGKSLRVATTELGFNKLNITFFSSWASIFSLVVPVKNIQMLNE